jgi:hypothetical protein
MTTFCDLAQGAIEVTGDELFCNDELRRMGDAVLHISGTHRANWITISRASVDITLSNAFVYSTSPLRIRESSVKIVFETRNLITGSGTDETGVECSQLSNVSIGAFDSGSSLTVSGGASGIGANRNGRCQELVILNGSIAATGETGIGGGSIENLTIMNGNVNASGRSLGAGIGSGVDQNGAGFLSFLRICNSTVAVSSLSGAGIGAAYAESAEGTIRKVTITDSVIAARSLEAPAIAGRRMDLMFSGQNLLNSTSGYKGPEVDAWCILLANASLIVVSASMPVFGTPPVSEGWFALTNLYREPTSLVSEPLSLLASPFIHIRRFDIVDYFSGTICVASDRYCRCFDGYSWGVWSAVISLPSEGDYTLSAILDGVNGLLQTRNNVSRFYIPWSGINISSLTFVRTARSGTPVQTSPHKTNTPLGTQWFPVSEIGGVRSSVHEQTGRLSSPTFPGADSDGAKRLNVPLILGIAIALLILGGASCALCSVCRRRGADTDSGTHPDDDRHDSGTLFDPTNQFSSENPIADDQSVGQDEMEEAVRT